MSIAISKGRFRAVLAGLLILCLSSAAMPMQWLSGRDDPGAGSGAVLFIPRSANSAASILANGMRNRFNGFDDLFKAAIIHGQTPIVFARNSSPYPFNHEAGVSHRTDRTVLPIRAPPLYYGCQS